MTFVSGYQNWGQLGMPPTLPGNLPLYTWLVKLRAVVDQLQGSVWDGEQGLKNNPIYDWRVNGVTASPHRPIVDMVGKAFSMADVAGVSTVTLSQSPSADTSVVGTSRSVSTTVPLTGGGDLSANRTLSIPASNTTTDGYLTSTDWNTFNNKVDASGTPVDNQLAIWTGPKTIEGSADLVFTGSALTVGIGNVVTISSIGTAGSPSEHFGAGSDAGGNRSSAFGPSANASGATSAAFGYNSSAAGQNSLALGSNNAANALGDTAIGTAVSCTGSASAPAFGLGYRITVTGVGSIGIGSEFLTTSAVTGAGTIAIGRGGTHSGDYGGTFGQQASQTGNYGWAVGRSSSAGANEFVVGGSNGSTNYATNNWYCGAGKTAASASSIAWKLNATGGTGTNVAASDIYLCAGIGTGNATPASFYLQATTAGSSGATLQTLRTLVQGNGTGLGFFGVAPVARAAAYTQTYSTAARTIAAYTSDAESVAYTGIDNAQAGTPYAQLTDLNALRTAYDNLRASYDGLIQVVNSIIDDLQAYGLMQ